MKKLVILFLAVSLVTACNNHNPFAGKDGTTKNTDKDAKDDKDKKEEGGDTRRDKDDDTPKDEKGNWTSKDRTKWMDKCLDVLNENRQAKQICSCVLEKVERKYPDITDAEEASEAEGERMMRECTAGTAGGEDGNTDDKFKDKTDGEDRYKKEEVNTQENWTSLQFQQFVQGCTVTAKQAQGFTTQQANAYCECMTKKVEKKYSFRDAAKLKATDFQTQEWIDAAADCRPRQ